jgi:hypothetical protein
MKAKNVLHVAAFAMLLAISFPANSTIVLPEASKNSTPIKVEDPRMAQLLHRLEDIKAMNLSELSRSEKKSLRKEVKGIKKEMRATNRGIYLSVGAIIIIILLLILIL